MVPKLERKRDEELDDDKTIESDVYSEKARMLLIEDDELTPEEEGFMEGYEEAE